MLYIVVRFPNNDTFHVPSEIIAEHRTNYYADKEGFIKGSKEWDEEFKQSNQSYELFDWVENCMDWSDIKDHAIRQPIETYDGYYENMFTNATIASILK